MAKAYDDLLDYEQDIQKWFEERITERGHTITGVNEVGTDQHTIIRIPDSQRTVAVCIDAIKDGGRIILEANIIFFEKPWSVYSEDLLSIDLSHINMIQGRCDTVSKLLTSFRKIIEENQLTLIDGPECLECDKRIASHVGLRIPSEAEKDGIVLPLIKIVEQFLQSLKKVVVTKV